MDRRWLPAGALGLAAVVAGVWWGRGLAAPPVPPPPAAQTAASSTAAPSLVVHVSGWVQRPGLVTVPDGSRVGDVLTAAGGVRPGASLDGVNLAQPVVDGQQVVVPGPQGAGGGAVAADDGRVHLNTATPAELETLPGVGPVLAERIVAHRDARGGFDQVEDLLEVPGIGEAKLADLRDAVAVP